MENINTFTKYLLLNKNLRNNMKNYCQLFSIQSKLFIYKSIYDKKHNTKSYSGFISKELKQVEPFSICLCTS